MCVTLWGVEEEIADSSARDVEVFRCDVREFDAGGYAFAGPFVGGTEEVLFA